MRCGVVYRGKLITPGPTYAKPGNSAASSNAVRISLDNGEASVAWVKLDSDFEWLRQDVRFVALLAEMAART